MTKFQHKKTLKSCELNLIHNVNNLKMMKKIVSVIVLAIICGFSSFSEELIIKGNWKFTIDDNEEFSRSGFNDSDWTEVKTLKWTDSENSIIWLRKNVYIPSSLKAEFEKTGALTLSMGKIQRSDNTYLNGKLIGSSAHELSNRNYLLKPNDILWDKENTLAIRVAFRGAFSMSQLPTIKSASPGHFLVYLASLKNGDPKAPVNKKDLVFNLSLINKSDKAANGTLIADFYNLIGTKIHSEQKEVTLSIGNNTFEFPYNSPSPFLKVTYQISIPDYHYSGEWNAEYGYEDLVYEKVFPKINYQVAQKFEPAELGMQQIEGWLGNKMEINIEKRLHLVDENALLEAFINRPGNHPWIGEHIGKFLEAACNSYANTSDPALKIQIDRSAQQLIAAQLDDGYLGTYDLASRWTSWDVWSHKYNLVGLLRYYELSGFEPALEACEKIGDLLFEIFGSELGKKDIIKAGTHVGMAATSVLDPMTDLYRISGNKKYLDFCNYLIQSYNNPNGPRIISTIDSLGRVDKVANGKAYEMLSNLVGIAKLYRLTNNEKHINPVLTAWNDIVVNRLYITGTTSSKEYFQDDHILPATDNDNMGEGCVSTTWAQLNYQLFSIFGSIKYLDELERVVYNHLIGAESPQTGGVSYYTPLMGTKNYQTTITCCMSSIPRGIAMIPLFANGKMDHIPTFLFYQPGVYKTEIDNKNITVVEFNTVTNFPQSGDISITVHPEKSAKFKVSLRIPYWAEGFTVYVNNKKQKLTNNLSTIDRVWKKGDKIGISFSTPYQLLNGNISYPGQIAIQKGPQILVFDEKLNQVVSDDILLDTKNLQVEQSASSVLPHIWSGTQAYQVNALVNGENQKIILVPFSDAGQTGGQISTWLKRKN